MPSSDTDQPSVAVQVYLGNGTEVSVKRNVSAKQAVISLISLGVAVCVDAGYNPITSFRNRRNSTGSSKEALLETLIESAEVVVDGLGSAEVKNATEPEQQDA